MLSVENRSGIAMALAPIVPERIWCCQQPLRFGPVPITTRMTVVRLRDDALWVHSPIAPSPTLAEELQRLGRVCYVVAPNRSHHLFFRPFLEAHPEARGWVAPGLAAKRADLARFPELGAGMPWEAELAGRLIEGLPLINETVWFHAESGTLILTDLLQAIHPAKSWLVRMAARLLGVLGEPGMSRTMRMAIEDRRALRESIAPLLALPVERIVLAHDSIIEDDAAQRLSRAFAWLR